jgi:hypothetical protein
VGEPRTRVYLTVDVECAEERIRHGRLHPPLDYDLRVWGRFRNQAEDLGVPALLRELERTGARATFFVEALGAAFFGEGQLRALCRRLLDAGQDVQLHLHPVQRRADWHTRGERPAPDELSRYELEAQTALLREGRSLLEGCGVDAEALLAFRAGHYAASNETWRAMRASGLVLSSSYNLSYLHRTCGIRWPSPANALFRTDVPGVWELPVSNFAEGGGRHRHLEICAVSLREVAHYLREARRLGIGEVTIITHSFELFFLDSAARRRGRPNRLALERLRGVLAFLRDRPDEFELATVGALARELRAAGPGVAPGSAGVGVIPAGRLALRWGRMVEQARQRLAAKAGLIS